jgi:DNA-binding LytR/AlgR family response regulator
MIIAIIEDEKLAANNLELMIREIEPTVTLAAKLDSVKKSVEWLASHTADLLFVDVMLGDGTSFQIFEKIKVTTPVIFTTAYDQFAIKAFKLYSIAYLLKPINADELKEALAKYKFLKTQQVQTPNWEQLLQTLSKPVEYQSRFMVHAGDKIRSVKTSEIAYFQSKEGYTFLGTFDTHFYDISNTLEQLSNILDPSLFFRINRQFIVNIEAIQQMNIVSKSRIKLELKPQPDEEAIVSVNNVPLFKEWLNR